MSTPPTFVLEVYGHDQCAVCVALWPKLVALADERPDTATTYVDMKAAPEKSGQLGIFAAPVVRLMYGDRELQRWARHVGVGQIADALDRVRALASD